MIKSIDGMPVIVTEYNERVKLSIFGATGQTGRELARQALAGGHELAALARDPARLSISSAQLRVVRGDVGDRAAVSEAVRGAEAVLSVLGPSQNKPDFGVSAGMENIVQVMREQGVRRLVVSIGAGVADPRDKPTIIHSLLFAALTVMARYVYEDMAGVAGIVRASALDWTIVRVPMLTNNPATGRVRVGYVGRGTGPRLARADMARFMLEQCMDPTYLRQAPVISN